MSIKRPPLAIAIAAILGWLAISGFGGALVGRAVPAILPGDLPPFFKAFLELQHSSEYAIVSLVSGIAALFAAFAIFQLKPWKGVAYLAWCAANAAFGVLFSLKLPTEPYLPPVWPLMVATLVVTGLLACAYPFIVKLQPVPERANA